MLQAVQSEKPCKVCGKPFLPFRTTATVCSPRCGLRLGPIARKAAKADRQKTRARLDEMKPLSHWLRLAQVEVNRYVRLRDRHLGCISCDKGPNWDGQWHCSHFRSVGAASAVRFHLWNLNKSCSICNNWKSGNLSDYEPRLRDRIGGAKVDWLRAQNGVQSWDRGYLGRLTAVFRRKANRLEARC